MSQRTLLLASASPARRTTLIHAGITPLVMVADADEDALIADFQATNSELSLHEMASAQVQMLAEAKADAVETAWLSARESDSELATASALVACDSMLEIDGTIVGKPHTPDVARERLQVMSGNTGYLHTGHCVIDLETGTRAIGGSVATVHIGELSEAEIDAYIATGEPLHVAGSFTVDGFGGPFIDYIEGDYHGIVGISLPLLRQLLKDLGISITEFWNLPSL